ncbi:hypothetical protein CN353_32840, partial [Bacillus cereus]
QYQYIKLHIYMFTQWIHLLDFSILLLKNGLMVAQVLLIKMCATYYPYYDLFKRFLSTHNNLINFL